MRATVATIGVRELRQQASRYLELVEAGATIEVTRNGKTVARLVPARDSADPLQALAASGLLLPADSEEDLLDVIAAPPAPGRSTGEALSAMREEERW